MRTKKRTGIQRNECKKKIEERQLINRQRRKHISRWKRTRGAYLKKSSKMIRTYVKTSRNFGKQWNNLITIINAYS